MSEFVLGVVMGAATGLVVGLVLGSLVELGARSGRAVPPARPVGPPVLHLRGDVTALVDGVERAAAETAAALSVHRYETCGRCGLEFVEPAELEVARRGRCPRCDAGSVAVPVDALRHGCETGPF